MNKSNYVRMLELENKNYKNLEYIARLKRKIKYLEDRCSYLYEESEFWRYNYESLKEKALRNEPVDFPKADDKDLPF